MGNKAREAKNPTLAFDLGPVWWFGGGRRRQFSILALNCGGGGAITKV